MNSIFLGATDGHQIRRVYAEQVAARLRECAGLDTGRIYDKEAVLRGMDAVRQADYAFATWGMPCFSEEEIRSRMPNLKAVFYAAGTVQAFARPFLNCGVRIFSAWAANAVPVAEYAVSQILLANKGFYQGMLRQSRGDIAKTAEWCKAFPGNYHTKVGVLGVGMIGTMVIEALARHDLELLVFDPFLPQTRADSLGVRKCGLDEIFSSCQTISNHLANNEKTQGMLDYRLFSAMKPNACFLNTGRGAQVVEPDLVRALREQPGRTAVLDVTWPEPPEPDHPFYRMDNVFLTPHIAGSFGNEVVRMAEYMEDEYLRVAAGGTPLYEVTAERLETMA